MPGRRSHQVSDQLPAVVQLHSPPNCQAGSSHTAVVLDARMLLGEVEAVPDTPELLDDDHDSVQESLSADLQQLLELKDQEHGPVSTAAEAASMQQLHDPGTLRSPREQPSRLASQASSSPMAGRQSTFTPPVPALPTSVEAAGPASQPQGTMPASADQPAGGPTGDYRTGAGVSSAAVAVAQLLAGSQVRPGQVTAESEGRASSSTSSKACKGSDTAGAGATVTWPMIAKHIDQLLNRADASGVKEPEQLVKLCNNIQKLAAAACKEAAGSPAQQLAVRATCKLPHLLSQLLAARKRARDWKQAEYSSRVRSVLAAGVAVMELEGGKHHQLWVESMLSCDVASKVSAAQLEVAQLLVAQQQQQQGSDNQQQLHNTCVLAQLLLSWWRLALQHWTNANAHREASPAAVLTAYRDPTRPLRLALVLAHAMPLATDWLQVDQIYLITNLVHALVGGTASLPISQADAAALLQLSVAMMLLCSYVVQQQASGQHQSHQDSNSSRNVAASTTSSSSSSSSAIQAGTVTDGGTKDDTGCSIMTASSVTQQTVEEQGPRQRQQQVMDLTMQLWLAAGFAPAVLPALACPAAPSSVFSSKELSVSQVEALHQHGCRQLPAGISAVLCALVFLVDHVGCCLDMCSNSKQQQLQHTHDDADKQSYEFNTESLLKVEDLSTQQVQLLQAVVWPLPQFLLLTAQQGIGITGGAQLAAAALNTAWWCLCAWHMPGLHAAATSAAAIAPANTAQLAAGSKQTGSAVKSAPTVSTVQPLPELLGPLLDCWLQLMGQQLLGLLMEVNAAQQQQRAFDCSLMPCLSRLCLLLQPLSHIAAAPVWRRWLPQIMLMLEVINRRLLPLQNLHCKCGVEECRTGSSSSYSGRSTFQQTHLHHFDDIHEAVVLLLTKQHLQGMKVTGAGPERRLAERPPLDAHRLCRVQQQRFALLVSSIKMQMLQRVPFGCYATTVVGTTLAAAATAAAAKARPLEAASGSPMSGPQHTTSQAELCAELTLWLVLLGRWMMVAARSLWGLAGIAVTVCESEGPRLVNAMELSAAESFQGVVSTAYDLLQTAYVANSALLRIVDKLAARCTIPDELLHGSNASTAMGPKGASLVDVERESCSLATTGSAMPAARGQNDIMVDSSSNTPSISSSSTPAGVQSQLYRSDVAAQLTVPGQDHKHLLLLHQQQLGQHQKQQCDTVSRRVVLPACGDLQAALNGIAQDSIRPHVCAVIALATVVADRIAHLEKDDTAQQDPADGSSSSSSSSGSTRHNSECREGSTVPQMSTTAAATADDRFAENLLAGIEQSTMRKYADLSQSISHASSSAECVKLLFSQFSLNSSSPGLPQTLQAAGRSLINQLPVPWMCNNPDCTNMDGASELQLVGDSSCVCGGCRVARYCSRDCQASHWREHKPVCRELAAAAAGPHCQQAAGALAS